MLQPHVAEILFAEDAESGLQAWRHAQPDITLTELSVLNVDGLAMSEQIKADDPDAAIIVISALTESEHLQRAIDIGVDGYLYKPVDPVLLLNIVSRCLLDRKRLIDQRIAHVVFEVANEGIMVTDKQQRIVAVNPAFSEITGYRPDEIIGQKPSFLSAGKHPPEFYRSMWESLQTHGRWAGEIINRRKNGTLFSEWLSIAVIEGARQGAESYVGLISDITERKQEEEHIRRLAHFDSLTNLPNRVLFNDRLQRAIARAKRSQQTLGILYIDLDDFKEINDNYGHATGDVVLQAVATRLLGALRHSDTVSRRGGDEFVVIIELDGHPEGLSKISQKLQHALNQPLMRHGKAIKLGASIGAARYPDDADEPEKLLAMADSALYAAKAAGRGQLSLFNETRKPGASDTRLDMAAELREGLKNWRYSLHYLPEISLVTGELEHIEALLRFHHPEFGLLEAGRFLEIAEEIGIMPELGQKALAEAVNELSSLNEIYADLGLVIDLSARQLSAPDAVSKLLDTLIRAGMPTRFITFECPESAISSNEGAIQTLLALASSGCKFTLDDFGAGYCSFSLICQLPMSSIKIDCSFTSEIDTNPQIREVVAALIAFSKRLGLRAIAEGVETRSQLEYLRQSQCDTAQGYIFGRPMSRDRLREFLAAEEWRTLLDPDNST